MGGYIEHDGAIPGGVDYPDSGTTDSDVRARSPDLGNPLRP